MVAEAGDGLRHRLAAGQIALLGIGADEQRQAQVWQLRQDAIVPERGAFGEGRIVAAIGRDAGIAEAHGDDGNAGLVVECVAIKLKPVAQAIAAAVIEGQAGFVDTGAGGLADDEETGAGGGADDRARPQRQEWRADGAGARLGKSFGKIWEQDGLNSISPPAEPTVTDRGEPNYG